MSSREEPQKSIRVSIITPTKDHAHTLESTLLSVCNQTYKNIEHIVVDGASHDGTQELLDRYATVYNLRYISEPDSGQSAALNKAVRMVTGDLVFWLNADDVLLYDDAIASVVEAYEAAAGRAHARALPPPSAIIGDLAFLDKDGTVNQFCGFPRITERFLQHARLNLGQPSVILTAETYRAHPFNETLTYAMDFDFFVRTIRDGRVIQLRRVIAGARMYPGTKSSDMDAYRDEQVQVLQTYGHTAPEATWFTNIRERLRIIVAVRLRGLWLLLVHRLWRRSRLAAPSATAQRPLQKALKYQLFWRMRKNYEGYWR